VDEIGTIVDEGLGNASYLVDIGDGRALVIDPRRDPRPYLRAARERRMRIAFAAETHLHNDFVSGSRELAGLGATVLASSAAELRFDHRPVRDLEEIDLGGLTLRVLGTPGHTPEHVSYLLLDDAMPIAVFTGGALLKGAVARTDLLGEERAGRLAGALFRSLTERLLPLPDETVVHPTHGAGGSTFCSAAPAGDDGSATTIGRERAANPFLSPLDIDSFVRRLGAVRSSYPSYFRGLREINRRGPRTIGDHLPRLDRLTASEVRRAVEAGAVVIDARPIDDYAAGHVRGAIFIELRPAFATWLGWLVERARPLVFMLGQDQDREELVRRCLSIGFENLVGEIDEDAESLRAAMQLSSTETVDPRTIDVDRTIVDVRQRSEFETAHLTDALNVELGDLGDRADTLPEGPMTVHCSHGTRAMTAASILERHGRENVSVLLGSPEDVADRA